VPTPTNNEENSKKQDSPSHLNAKGELCYGYWREGFQTSNLSLASAQKALLDYLCDFIPPPPCQLLYVGNDPSHIEEKLANLGYSITCIDLSTSSKEDELDSFNNLSKELSEELSRNYFDAILCHGSLNSFSDLNPVFLLLQSLLKEEGYLILCDGVLHQNTKEGNPKLHNNPYIEQCFSKLGFAVYEHEKIGFEKNVFDHNIWKLKPGNYPVRPYIEKDEERILEAFNLVFNQNRTLDHWRWKYLDNPEGGPYTTLATHEDNLVAHYSAYPVSLTIEGQLSKTFHVGDTFTVPDKRGVGRGKTSLLSRTVRLFHKLWCENKIDFFYGFNTGRIQKLGKKILSYDSITPVYEFRSALVTRSKYNGKNLLRALSGSTTVIENEAGPWADTLFEKVKHDYKILNTRDRKYLTWRYDNHPDFNYHYVLIKKFGKTIGWSVIRQEGDDVLFVDALVSDKYARQLLISTQEAASRIKPGGFLLGWFSLVPTWWSNQLINAGFSKQRQSQELDLCLTFFSQRFNAEDIKEGFYFTMGDSDLF
jgi:SAM-dependent methyltransferase